MFYPEEIENVLPGFIGEIDQIPPKYSAKCVMGKRGYELARRGVDFTLEPKKVTIIDLKLIEKTSDDEFVFYIKCKGGTYVRSISPINPGRTFSISSSVGVLYPLSITVPVSSRVSVSYPNLNVAT